MSWRPLLKSTATVVGLNVLSRVRNNFGVCDDRNLGCSLEFLNNSVFRIRICIYGCDRRDLSRLFWSHRPQSTREERTCCSWEVSRIVRSSGSLQTSLECRQVPFNDRLIDVNVKRCQSALFPVRSHRAATRNVTVHRAKTIR